MSGPMFSKPDMIVFLVMAVLLGAAIIVCNLIIVIAFTMSAELRRSYTNIIAVNLAISDVFVGAILIPIWVTVLWTQHQIHQFNEDSSLTLKDMNALIDIFNSADVGLLVASTLNLVCLSVERGLMVAAPFWYRKHANRKFVIAFVATPWIYAAMMVALNANYVWKNTQKGYHQLFNFICGFVIPTIVITLSYAMIAVSALQSKRRVTIQKDRVGNVSYRRREIMLALKLLLLLLGFLVCWFPYFVVYIIVAFGRNKETLKKKYKLLLALKFLAYFNSLLDPFLYIMVRKPFRVAIRYLLGCRKRHQSRAGHIVENMSQKKSAHISLNSCQYETATNNSLDVIG